MDINTPIGTVDYDIVPDTCPMCNHGIEPKLICSNIIERQGFFQSNNILELIFRCPRNDCQEAFIGYYIQHPKKSLSGNGPYYFQSAAPFKYKATNIPPEVTKISPNFLLTYAQSNIAELHKLDQIAGAGYRKSLEYLVKDYCITKFPDKDVLIKNTWLANCIETYIDDTNIRSCALRATWLGNDETHYVRKWEEKDIKDLKVLIELTIGWIRNQILTEKYNKEMT